MKDRLHWLPSWLRVRIERSLLKSEQGRAAMDKEFAPLLEKLEREIHPYDDLRERRTAMPMRGVDRATVLDEVKRLAERERSTWLDGFVSGGIYHGDKEHIDLLNACYAEHAQSNPLHPDVFASAVMFEEEIISMVASMLGKGTVENTNTICGTVTSGGTESILLAMRTYRESARTRGIKHPEIVAPVTAHVAFDKAAEYFGMKLIKIPVDENGAARQDAMIAAIGKRTAVVVASAPCFPYGVIDPIATVAAVAVQRGVGIHVDACLGGFILPFAERAGATVSPFDFRVSGVTSMSVDTHKYGYAAKGTSVVLYRTEELRRHQFFASSDWPGGLYASPTLAGSRPGGLSAACWAALMSIGEDGYVEATAAILHCADRIKRAVAEIQDIRIIGDPLFVLAFTSDTLNVYEVLDRMSKRGWRLNGLQRPAAFHLALTLRHTQPGVVDRFITDLRASVHDVRDNPGSTEGMAPVYGMAASMPFRGVVTELLKRYLGITYRSS
jgi:glutamate/tyrosine decarboxylase-like PLP-dependent enzyme